MITESVIEKAFYLVSLILYEFFHDLNFDVLVENFNTLSGLLLDIFAYVYYFLPVPYLLPIIGIVAAVAIVRITIALTRLVSELGVDILKFILGFFI